MNKCSFCPPCRISIYARLTTHAKQSSRQQSAARLAAVVVLSANLDYDNRLVHRCFETAMRCAFLSTTVGPTGCATLPTRSHSACCWSHFTTSTAVIIFICPAAAGNATHHIGDRTIAVAGPRAWNNTADIHHRLFVIAHFQTTSQHLSIQSIILSTYSMTV